MKETIAHCFQYLSDRIWSRPVLHRITLSAKETGNSSGRLTGTSLDCLTSIVENLRQG